MRSVPELCARALAFSVALLGLSVLAGPGCFVSSLVDSGKDCQAACNTLNMCGLIQTPDCGAYCTGEVSGAAVAGCNDQLDAQNACAKANTQCTAASAQTCAPQTTAFAMCMKSYCDSHPMGTGCPELGDGGTGGGGTTGDGGS